MERWIPRRGDDLDVRVRAGRAARGGGEASETGRTRVRRQARKDGAWLTWEQAGIWARGSQGVEGCPIGRGEDGGRALG